MEAPGVLSSTVVARDLRCFLFAVPLLLRSGLTVFLTETVTLCRSVRLCMYTESNPAGHFLIRFTFVISVVGEYSFY